VRVPGDRFAGASTDRTLAKKAFAFVRQIASYADRHGADTSNAALVLNGTSRDSCVKENELNLGQPSRVWLTYHPSACFHKSIILHGLSICFDNFLQV